MSRPPPRESILKTAKALVEDTKLLVAGAASSQDKLAQAAHSSAKTITQLTEVVKLGATSMGSEGPETQVTRYDPRSSFTALWLLRHQANLGAPASKGAKCMISLVFAARYIFAACISALQHLWRRE